MVHDLSYKYFPDAYSWMFRMLYGLLVPAVLAKADHIFTVADTELEAIRAQYPRLLARDRITALQNGGGEAAPGMNASDLIAGAQPGESPLPSREARGRRCLYVGSLTRRKNAAGLLRAARLIVGAGEGEFTIVGATGSSFEEALEPIPYDDRDGIELLGQVNDWDTLEDLYRRAAVFVFPSFYEASPLPPIEAMSLGCPVVAADIPSLRERCGEAALYCDPTSAEEISAVTLRLLNDDALWSEMQHRGLDRARSFTWRRQVTKAVDQMARLA